MEDTIRSVLDQSYPNLEYIIIDGGSTDSSPEIIRKYSDRLAFWCSEPDRGQTHAINKGLLHATGDIIAYLCSDDQYRPGTFETVVENFTRFPEKSWLTGSCRFHRPDGSEYQWVPEPPPQDRVLLVCSPWGVPQPANFWRRELFSSYGLFREDLNYVMDTEFQVRLVLAGEIPLIIQRELTYSVLHPDCKTMKSEHMQLQEQSDFLGFFWDQLSKDEQVRGRMALCFRDSGVAAKLGKPRVLQYLLYAKGWVKSLRVSPWLTVKKLVGILRRSLVRACRTRWLDLPR